MSILENILTLSISGSIIAAIIVFLGKTIIQRSSDIIIENHKNKLDLLKIEHQVKFSKLSEERGQVIKELYNSLFELELKLSELTTIFQGPEWIKDESRVKNANEQLVKAKKLLEINRIFFPESLCNEIDTALNEARDVIYIMLQAKNAAELREYYVKVGENVREKEGERPLDLWLKAQEKVNTQILEQRLALANSFRSLIGVK